MQVVSYDADQIMWHILLIPFVVQAIPASAVEQQGKIFSIPGFHQYVFALVIVSPIWCAFCEYCDLNSQTGIPTEMTL